MKKALALLLLAAGSLFASFAGNNAYAGTAMYGNSPIYLDINLSGSGMPDMGTNKLPPPPPPHLGPKPPIPAWVWVMVADYVAQGLVYVLEVWGQSEVNEACTCYEAAKNAQDDDDDNPAPDFFGITAGGEDWEGLGDMCG